MVNKGMEGGQEIARVRGESKGRMAEYIIDGASASTATHVLVNGAQAQSKWDFAPLIIIDMTESGKDDGESESGDRAIAFPI